MKIPKYAVVVVHGISDKKGDQQKNFSKALAEKVLPDQSLREKYWHEAVWEPVNNALDDKIQDVVLQLVNTYDKTSYWRDAELAKAKSKLRKAWVWLWWCGCWVVERLLANKITRALDLVLDLPMYLGNPKGEKIREVVKATIQKALKVTPEGVVLVGHSLGSVIAYDVLRESLAEDGKHLSIKAFVTMGSPLAWVTDLRIADGETPDSVIRLKPVPWVNFYDEEDPVSMKDGLPTLRFADVQNEPAICSGKKYIGAHTVYWHRDEVAKKIRDLIL